MAFVADTFYALTGTAIDAARLRQWTAVLETTTPTTAAQSAVLWLVRTSTEYRARLVRQLYQAEVGREPTQSELSWALSLFRAVPVLASDFADGGWSGVRQVILAKLSS